ncbi:MAG: 4-hydroxythreonine-4-phosphate dehydrogenase PdxA [Candidatus Omnitrophica bacterium]|nr:4-hydroxythreonine-4-phosphate dehydrogenase PdxA [Candidatus Omnitrophota bacterium]
MKKIKVCITMGDPSGIGPVILVKALRKLNRCADFTIIGSEFVLNKVGWHKHKFSNVKLIDLDNVPRKGFSFGKIKKEYGRASIEYLNKALDLLKTNQVDCLVTCPVSKEAINRAGIKFSGHTEYIAESFKVNKFEMMLINNCLKTLLVTRHIPLNNVSLRIDKQGIKKAVLLANCALKRMFAIKEPRIVISGLNPHASDNGVIGNEENKVIKPAVRDLRLKSKVDISGPLSADVAIYKAYNKEFDCVVAMFHDQALIPLKLTGKNEGVNITIGLPFVRTSPLHGTAFDIAKSPNRADSGSLIEAIKLAIQCTLNQKNG